MQKIFCLYLHICTCKNIIFASFSHDCAVRVHVCVHTACHLSLQRSMSIKAGLPLVLQPSHIPDGGPATLAEPSPRRWTFVSSSGFASIEVALRLTPLWVPRGTCDL